MPVCGLVAGFAYNPCMCLCLSGMWQGTEPLSCDEVASVLRW